MKIKTIRHEAKEWFDKINGNSYFSAKITINEGMKSQKVIKVPFQYGYGDHYNDMCFEELQKLNIIEKQENHKRYWRYYKENNIKFTCYKIENCLKREVKKNE